MCCFLTSTGELQSLHLINESSLYYELDGNYRPFKGGPRIKRFQNMSRDLANIVLAAAREMTNLHTLEIVDQFSNVTLSRCVLDLNVPLKFQAVYIEKVSYRLLCCAAVKSVNSSDGANAWIMILSIWQAFFCNLTMCLLWSS